MRRTGKKNMKKCKTIDIRNQFQERRNTKKWKKSLNKAN